MQDQHIDKVLFLYASHDGQTIKIMRCIEEEYKESHTSEWLDLTTYPNVDLSLYKKVIVGAGIRYGYLHKSLYTFINKHLKELITTDVSFFCVNLTARKEGKDTPETNAYMRTFLKKSPWIPKHQAVFAGGLYYPRYKWFDKMMIKLIMHITKGETDTSKEVEYTDWERVKVFAKASKNP